MGATAIFRKEGSLTPQEASISTSCCSMSIYARSESGRVWANFPWQRCQFCSADPDSHFLFPLPPRGCLRRYRGYLRDNCRWNVPHPRGSHACEEFFLGGYGKVLIPWCCLVWHTRMWRRPCIEEVCPRPESAVGAYWAFRGERKISSLRCSLRIHHVLATEYFSRQCCVSSCVLTRHGMTFQRGSS